jgi:microcystin-dependent protein
MANFLKSLFIKGVEIDTTGASTGNVLSYNGSKFAPAAPGSGSLALDDLSDVTVSSAEQYQTLVYDGSTWINEYPTTVSLVNNAESTTLQIGEVVYLYGNVGNHASVKRADNDGDSTSAKTVGVVAEAIAAGANGPVVTRGYVTGMDLSSGYTAGQTLYLGENGGYTTTKPYAPEHLVYVGVVVRATNNGIIYVATQNGYELDEIHDVDLVTNAPASGDFLKYNGTLWVNDAINLGTDTVGNYMSDVSSGTGISVSHTPSEGSTATVSVDTAYSGFSPVGAVQMYAGSSAPTGWAICDGAELAIASYGALYAVIGTRYGALTNGSGGAGSTHFKLPSFSARVPKGLTTGTPTVPTTITSNSSSAVDVHTHGVNSSFTAGNVNSSFTAGSVNSSFTAGNATSHTHSFSANSGNESNYHYHFWSAAGVGTSNSGNHTHSYFKPNSGANNNTGGGGDHSHTWSLFGQRTGAQSIPNAETDQLHYHSVSGTTGNPSATSINSSFTAGNVNSSFTAGSVNSSFTAGNASTINSSTPSHTHTVPSVDIVFIIRVS